MDSFLSFYCIIFIITIFILINNISHSLKFLNLIDLKLKWREPYPIEVNCQELVLVL